LNQLGLIGYGIAFFTAGGISGVIIYHFIYRWWRKHKRYTVPEFAVEHSDDWNILKKGEYPDAKEIRQACEDFTTELANTYKMGRDWLQADFKLVTTACRNAGWERNNHDYPSTGDDIASYIKKSQAREEGLRETLEKIKRIARILNGDADNDERPWTEGCKNIIALSNEGLSSTSATQRDALKEAMK